MEFVEGETLAQVLARMKESPPGEKTAFGFPRDDVAFYSTVARCFADVADGLQHAHSKGIIHRDIKPSNLILDGEGRLRILDFGLARLEGQESLTISGDIVGTPLYMSPEQARRKKIAVDHRTDVYSLGATLYEMLALRPPFSGKDHQDTLSQIIERDPVEPRKVNPRVPRDLETIVLKCLRKDAGDRYGTAEALGQDLRRFVRGEVIEARPEGRGERLARRVRRHRVQLLVLLTILLLVGACGFLAIGFNNQRRREAVREYERAVVLASLKLLRGDLIAPGRDLARGLFISHRFLADFRDSARETVAAVTRELEAAVTAVPERFEGHYVLARGLALLDRNPEAAAAARRACALESGFPPALSLLEGLGQPIEQSPSPTVWGAPWRLANEAARQRNWDAAIAPYEELIALEAQSPQRELYLGSTIAHVLARGVAHLGRRDYERAKLDFQAARTRAQAYSEEILEPTLLLAKVLTLGGSRDLAASLLREVLARTGEGSETTALLVVALHESITRDLADAERFADAVGSGRQAVELLPGSLDAHLILGSALLRLIEASGESGTRPKTAVTAEAFRELGEVSEKLLALRPEDSGVRQFLSRVWEARGDLGLAREAYRQALELDATTTKTGDASMLGGDVLRGAALAGAAEVGMTALAAEQVEYFEGGYFQVEGRVMDSCVNTAGPEWGVGLSRDGRRLFYGAGGAGVLDLFMATWDEAAAAFANCRRLAELNSDSWETGASLSIDGSTLYFESTRQGGGQFLIDLFKASWDPEQERFVDVLPLAALDSLSLRFRPSISASGLELYFNQQVSDWDGNMDIWVAWRGSVDEPFTNERARALPEVNSSHDEFTPVIHADGKALFWTGWTTNSHAGGPPFRSSSLWIAARSDTFDPSRHLDPPHFADPKRVRLTPDVHVFSAAVGSDWPAEGAKLYFVSCLASQCPLLGSELDIYSATWHVSAPASRFRRSDVNADGLVNISDTISTLRALFYRTGGLTCEDARDANDDGLVDIADAVTALGMLLLGQGEIPSPGVRACGVDPTADALDCAAYAACP
jgi:tetratricopeptide (TPR) repeat protein